MLLAFFHYLHVTMSTVSVPVYWLSLMHRSHLLWSPLQPGGSPRWLVTDAHNCCCPWLECSPSLQIKKIKLSFPSSLQCPTCPSWISFIFSMHELFSITFFCLSCGLVCISTVQHFLCICLSPLLSILHSSSLAWSHVLCSILSLSWMLTEGF